MRDLKAPYYIHVTANDDAEIRNKNGELVTVYYNHDKSWCDNCVANKKCVIKDEFPGADIDVLVGGAEALELLREVMENGIMGDLPERIEALLEKVDKRKF